MSNSNNNRWDPRELQFPADQAAPKLLRRRRRKVYHRGRFIAGPIDVEWLAKARRLGVSALWMGLALWYLRGLRKTDGFVVSNRMMKSLNLEPDAKRRALRKLEAAGLIAISQRQKRSPLVTLILPMPPDAVPA
jgi:DNA-binding transcriptional ArsR family regulator